MNFYFKVYIYSEFKTYSSIHKFGVRNKSFECLWKKTSLGSLSFPKLHSFNQKYSKNSNIVIYYYNVFSFNII